MKPTGPRAAPAAIVVLTAAVLTSCQDREVTDQTSFPTVTPGQIAESPDAFEGRKVRIESAEVEDVRTARLFTLDEDDFGAAPDVMVLLPSAAPGASVEDGTRVTVVGTVREMNGPAFRRDYHWWDEGAFTTEIDMIGARPVLIAESVTTAAGVELASVPAAGANASAARGYGPGEAGAAATIGRNVATPGDPVTIQLTARDYRFEPDTLTVSPGQDVRVELVNNGSHEHSVEFHLAGSEAELDSPIAPGQTGSLSFKTPTASGKYIYYCPVGNHRSRGMHGTLIVSAH